MRENPLIFDIKRGSTTDGPGIRTVIFLKGCNLNCFWCHNPEGKSPQKQMAFFREKCVACGVCRTVCASPEECVGCEECVKYCPAQARKCYGTSYTKEELMAIICADKHYYLATGGGVTFSGGECMLYPAFVAEVAAECQKNEISVAIDTAGAVPYAHFEQVLPYADIFLYDVKCLDSELHRKGTGVENERILENLERLKQAGKKIVVRIPEIPSFNQGEEVEKIKEYCNLRELSYEVLSYHELGEEKKRALNWC